MTVVQDQEHLLGLWTRTETPAMTVVQDQEHLLGLWTGTGTLAMNVVQAGTLARTVGRDRNACYECGTGRNTF